VIIDLDPRIEQELHSAFDTGARRGEVLPSERLQTCYATFRDRFGPEKLRSIDGAALLQAMHTHGNKDSLVYWLEFKNDEEFPGPMFGSISGGSAHKFGLFRRKDTGQWVKGSPQNEENISEQEAIAVARNHRDQLLAGVSLLEKLPANSENDRYLQLQEELARVAPDISDRAWSHKYLSLLFPDKLDDYHNHRWQRFHLVKLLQLPPEQEGLYVAAGRFQGLARQFAWPMNHLSYALNERNGGRPIGYWRIGTKLGQKESIWSSMRDGGYVAIGWDMLGDLTPLAEMDDLKETIRQKLEREYPNDPKTLSRKAGEIRNFVKGIAEGDVVVAADGQTVVGTGRVIGPYRYENSAPSGAPHRRAVDWISLANWNLPEQEGKLTTVFPIGKHEENLVEIEKRLLDGNTSSKPKPVPIALGRPPQLEGIPGRIQRILDRKGQAILYGPPGTGKTYWARKTAFDLAALRAFGRVFDEISAEQKLEVEGTAEHPGFVRCCTFHPAYGYEDFLEGFRPHLNQLGNLTFQLRDGIFKRICTDASQKPDQNFFLLVDEINRGDIPRIFGELLTSLELDKRGFSVSLPVSQESFAVPKNIYVIGTMNTADRSIALLDTALRRRFGFVELMPETGVFISASVEGSIPLGPWLSALNDRIRMHLGRDSRNLQIGHAYLLENGKPVTDFSRFVRVLREDIIPLLEEYCYEDYAVLIQILGKDLVDETKQRIREELFTSSRREELVQALLSPSPDIVTSPDAAVPAPTAEEPEESELEATEP
jgi:5-methylcytosine-specific restriction protein B